MLKTDVLLNILLCCNDINVLTVTFDQLNVSKPNKSINLLKKNKNKTTDPQYILDR